VSFRVFRGQQSESVSFRVFVGKKFKFRVPGFGLKILKPPRRNRRGYTSRFAIIRADSRATSSSRFRVFEPEHQFDQKFSPQISKMVADLEVSNPRLSAESAGKSYSPFPLRPPVRFIARLMAASLRQVHLWCNSMGPA
jgi:hypothetical protein